MLLLHNFLQSFYFNDICCDINLCNLLWKNERTNHSHDWLWFVIRTECGVVLTRSCRNGLMTGLHRTCQGLRSLSCSSWQDRTCSTHSLRELRGP